MSLTKSQQAAYDAARAGEWFFSHEIFPHWVHRQEWTANRLFELGLFQIRTIEHFDRWMTQYRKPATAPASLPPAAEQGAQR